ncbi:radical SAM protein [uncultured Eubacterium sp.]|uniref:radical SAM protein n=1 Tax=uncultured Eubacterium sp. TaxID=165185 RepID=UPI0025FDC4AB|nr:radical SAM protein [uncultured Eubacterium sp.]
MICNQCPRRCNVDRENALGYCRAPNAYKLARASLHFWEEPCISGKSGSGAVFFSGCNLGCVFCQNYEISHKCKGVEVSEERLIRIFEHLVDEGANNINLVNPTHYAVQLAHTLKKYKPPVPVVYNTSGYDSVDTLKLLDGLVDIYLPDFKYMRNDKALRYSRAEDYPQFAMAALTEMKRQVGNDVFDENGIMKRGMIIRHLVLPGNTNSAIQALDYLAENFGDTYISVMAQYVPCTDLSEYKEINRKITKREYDKIVNHILELGLEKVFLQKLESATEDYIPDFDLSGVVDLE